MNNEITETPSFHARWFSRSFPSKFVIEDAYEEMSSIQDFVEHNKAKEPRYVLKKFFLNNPEYDNITSVITMFCFSIGAISKEHKESLEVHAHTIFARDKSGELSCKIVIGVRSCGGGPEIEIELLQRIITEKDLIIDGDSIAQYIYTNYEKRLLALVSYIRNLCDAAQVKHNLDCIMRCPACSRLTFIEEDKEVCQFCDPEAYRAKKAEDERIAKTHGYVYFCTDDQYIKIGSSKKYPDKRILSLSTKYHKKFTLLGYIYAEDFREKEREVHGILSPQRVAGEWFNISLDALRAVLSEHSFSAKFLDPKGLSVPS